MTDRDREDIRRYRQEGYGYRSIAKQLGVPVGTIRTYCLRHKEELEAPMPAAVQCKMCGKPLVMTVGKKAKTFCSDACRMRWWNAHPEEVRRKAYYSFVCPQCGKPFMSYGNSNRKYCSHTCANHSRKNRGVANG